MPDVRFIHASDVHLGSPLDAESKGVSTVEEAVNRATYNAFEEIINWALELEVDFLVLAGDIYDKESRSVRANQFLIDQFERLRASSIPVFLVYGNHDPMGSGHEFFEFPDNVTRFPSGEPGVEEIEVDGSTVARVLGQSYRSRHEERTMYRQFTPADETVPNVGVLHTSLAPQSNRYVPCSASDLRGKEAIDYWALGHKHGLNVYDGDPRLAYPGVPQGRSAGEAGPGGCLLVEVGSGSEAALTFLPTSEVIWLDRKIDLSGRQFSAGNLDDLREILEDQCRELLDSNTEDFLTQKVENTPVDYRPPEHEVKGYIVNWTFSGRSVVHDQLLEKGAEARGQLLEELRDVYGESEPFVWSADVNFRTAAPIPGLDELVEQDEVYRQLQEIVDEWLSSDEQTDQLAAMAGDLWNYTEEPEEVGEKEFQLSREKLNDLIERARDRVIDSLYEATQRNVD